MISVAFVLEMPHGGDYIGGIASIINQYIENNTLFETNGIKIRLLDLNSVDSKKRSRLSGKVLALFRETKHFCKEVKDRPYDTYHFHSSIGWTLFKDLCIIKSARKHCLGKIVLSIHFADIEKILPKNKLLRVWELGALKKYCDKIVFLSKKTAKDFIDNGISEEKVSTLYTFHSYEVDNRPNNTRAPIVELLFMGSIDKRKGIIDLLKAVEKINIDQYHLSICGQITNEAIKDEFTDIIKELNNNVTFWGYVSGETKEKLLRKSDILILPSYGEGMPIVIMEGMSLGCAIIATRVGAIPEIVGVNNGILIDPGDVSALYESIYCYIKDRALLDTIQSNNFEYGKIFSIKKNIISLANIYKTL